MLGDWLAFVWEPWAEEKCKLSRLFGLDRELSSYVNLEKLCSEKDIKIK